jgi:hypothetical protein
MASTQKQGSISTDPIKDINLISTTTLKSIEQELTNGVNSTIRTHSHEQDGFIAIDVLRH